MWHPPNPVTHKIPDTRWPSAEEAGRSMLFSPIRIGPVQLANRGWVPAMVPWRATEEGFVTQDILDWYGRFARGKPGAIVVEATGVRDIPSGPLLRMGHDRFLPGLRQLVETVRRESGGETRLFIQILDFLAVKRRPEKRRFFERFLEITQRHRSLLPQCAGDAAIREHLQSASEAEIDRVLDARERESLRFGYRERVTDTHLPHIAALPQTLPLVFSQATVRAKQAGFDGVELHFAHAYTMAGFLSARNDRKDGYGGAREHRVRLPLEIYAAVREQVGRDFVVGVRYLGDEVIEGGSHLEDAVYCGREFARAGFDYLSISKGGKFEDAKQPAVGEAVYPYTGRSGYECMPSVISDAQGPFGRNIHLAAAIRAAVRAAKCNTPLVTAGGIATFEKAESILQRGEADLIAAARQSLADPDWWLKMRLGFGEKIRRCTYTNYCEGLDRKHKQVTCKLWDREGLDSSTIPRTADGVRRLVAPEWKTAERVGER